MSSALHIFDYCQTIVISTCLLITIPLASFIYCKLLFVRPFSKNYTFKLIVTNGVVELLQSVMYLISFQLTSYPFMYNYYTFIQHISIGTPLIVITSLLLGLSLHTTFFVALNRMKTMIFLRRQSNDSVFFLISILLSSILSLPGMLDSWFTTTVSYEDYTLGDSLAVFPILLTVSFIVKSMVSFVTLLVNIFLTILLTRERQYIDMADRNKFNGEKGLVITSIVSYTFHMLFFVNNLIARYFNVLFCGYAQWLFLGLSSITPFWCLILFTPTVRRMAFNRRRNMETTTIIHSLTPTV